MRKLWWIISGGKRRITKEIERLILSIERQNHEQLVRDNPDTLFEEF